ncbi:MAG: flagellar basal body P-ring formation chaperone FlgA [Bacteroidales bacterium]|nr:flagellar basal body P-ring formation chaperone FlgA [Candidatus Latescibacterota bacterium]
MSARSGIKTAMILAGAVTLLAQVAAAGGVFTLREEVEMDHSVVRLSDVVHEDIGDMKDVVLMETLPWGATKGLSRNFILNRTRSLDIELNGPVRVVLTRKMAERSAEIQKVLHARLAELFAGSKLGASVERLEIEFRNFPSRLMVPDGDYSLECRFPGNISGYRVISFTIRADDGYKRRFSTGCLFHVPVDCAVALRAIGRQEIVAREDIEWVEKDLASCYEMPVTRERDIYGMRVDRYVRCGDLIALSAMERVPDVAKGSAVLVEVSRGLMVVSANGISLEDGWMGDNILVRNKASGKIDKYRVIARGKVVPLTSSRKDS